MVTLGELERNELLGTVNREGTNRISFAPARLLLGNIFYSLQLTGSKHEGYLWGSKRALNNGSNRGVKITPFPTGSSHKTNMINTYSRDRAIEKRANREAFIVGIVLIALFLYAITH